MSTQDRTYPAKNPRISRRGGYGNADIAPQGVWHTLSLYQKKELAVAFAEFNMGVNRARDRYYYERKNVREG